MSPDGRAVFDALFAFVGHYRPQHPDLTPRQVRLHPATAYRIRAALAGSSPRHAGLTSLIGLAVIDDPRLPQDVWRVCADDGRLIHDSRSGRTLA